MTVTSASIARGGGRAPDALIGSKRQVLNVMGWTPSQSDEEVLHSRSVKINVEALNSALLDVRRDEGADFSPGTFSNVGVVGDELNLLASPFTEDWEGITPLNNWTQRFTTGNFSIIDDGTGNKVLRGYVFNQEGCRTADDGPNASDVEVRTRYQFKDTDKLCGVVARITGTGSSCRGYEMLTTYSGNYVQLRRITGDGSAFGLGTQNLGVNHSIDTWYWIAYKVVGSNHYAKWWVDGSAEPGSWTWIASDSTHGGPGDCGVFFDSGVATENFWFDDFSAQIIPPAYQTSGYWEGSDDVTSVDHYSHGLVSWIETTPTDTTVAVKIRWPGGTWQICANGRIIPDIDYEQDMRAGSTKQTLEWRVELTTTDTTVTPAVEDLRVYFEPGRQEEFELEVYGISCVPDDNSLLYWGRGWIGASGVPASLEEDWSDLWAASNTWWLAQDLQTITATFKYWANVIDSITFKTEGSKYRLGYLKSYFSIPVAPFYTGANIFTFTTLTEWSPNGKIYEWVLTDKGMAIHADAKFVVGHAQRDDHPLSFLVSVANLHDHPLSVQVRGWQRDDHPMSLLVQGWQRDDYPLSVTVGLWTLNDQPISMLAAIENLHDHPISFQVFGVDRESMVEVNIIDNDTWLEMAALGFTRS